MINSHADICRHYINGEISLVKKGREKQPCTFGFLIWQQNSHMSPAPSLGQFHMFDEIRAIVSTSYKMKKIVGLLVFVLALASQSVFAPVKGKNLMLSFIQCVQLMEKGLFC